MIKLIKDKKNFVFDSFEEQNVKKNLINKNNVSFLLKNSKENSNNNSISKKKFINLLNITNNNSNENSLRNKLITSKIKIKSRNKINNENNDDNNNNLNFCFTDTNKKIYKDSSMQTNFNINKNKLLEQKKFEFYGLLSKKNKNSFIENSKNKLYSIKTNTNFVPINENSNKKLLFKNRILNNINNNYNQNVLNNYKINSYENKNILLKTNKIKNLSNREINLMKNPESYFYQIYYGLEYFNKIKKEQIENKNLKKKKKEYFENFEKMKEPANHVLNKLKLDFVLEDYQKSKMISSKTFLDYNVRMKF